MERRFRRCRSNNTNLCEPIRIVNEDMTKLVGDELLIAAACGRKVREAIRHTHLAAAQFPDPLRSLRKPETC